MKIKKIIILLALSSLVTACNNQSQKVENNQINQGQTELADSSNQDSEQGLIYTSIYPIYNLTKQIAGDKFEIRNFASLKTESHGWEPSAKDMAELSGARLLFINGAGMEEWKDSVADAIDIEIVDTSRDVDLIDLTDYDHDHDNEEHDHNHGPHDPHIWISAVAGKQQAEVIANKLAEIDPANADYYMENYQKIADELDELIAEYEEKFAQTGKSDFVVNHKAFSYMARDFDLNQIALTDITSTDDEGARDVKDTIDLAKELEITTIFYEKGTDGKSAKTIAEEIGADVATLNTMEFATDEDLENETSYQELIRANLEAIYQSMIN